MENRLIKQLAYDLQRSVVYILQQYQDEYIVSINLLDDEFVITVEAADNKTNIINLNKFKQRLVETVNSLSHERQVIRLRINKRDDKLIIHLKLIELSWLDKMPSTILFEILKDHKYQEILDLCLTSQELNKKICQTSSFWADKYKHDVGFHPPISPDLMQQAYVNHGKVLAFGINWRAQLGLPSEYTLDEDIHLRNVNLPTLIDIPYKIIDIIPGRQQTLFKDEYDRWWFSGLDIFDDETYHLTPIQYDIAQRVNSQQIIKSNDDILKLNILETANLSLTEGMIDGQANLLSLNIDGNLKLLKSNLLWGISSQNLFNRVAMLAIPSRRKVGVSMTNEIKYFKTGYTCIFYINHNDELYVRGLNDKNKLGIPSNANFIMDFTKIDLPFIPVEISCGFWHTAILDAEGDVWVCGNNNSGELGLGQINIMPTFTQILSIPKIKKISCGFLFTILLDIFGHLWVTGSNNYGQLGLGDFKNRSIFTMIPIEVEFIDIECGRKHVLAIDRDHNLYTWGSNENGQLGLGNLYPTNIINDNNEAQLEQVINRPTKVNLDFKIQRIYTHFMAATSFARILY